MNEELLKKELKKFKQEHPEWGRGELRDMDEDPRQRHTYRDKNGKVKNIKIINFSDLITTDDEGNEIPFEETITYEDNAF